MERKLRRDKLTGTNIRATGHSWLSFVNRYADCIERPRVQPGEIDTREIKTEGYLLQFIKLVTSFHSTPNLLAGIVIAPIPAEHSGGADVDL